MAREGSVTGAAEKLGVSQPAISAQIKKLEEALGQELFDRSGRSLTPSPEGRLVLEFADEIFGLGRELTETLRGSLEDRPVRLYVGVTGSIAKMVSHHLLEPAFELSSPVHIIIREDRPDRLLAQLATHELDLVLSDAPIPPNISIQAFNHPLGWSGVSIFGSPELTRQLEGPFPACLDRAPFLFPSGGYTLRKSLDDWFAGHNIQPRTVAEIDDSALIKVFAESGTGLFAAPAVIAAEICATYGLVEVGTADPVRERYFAITTERRIKHPAVVAISTTARAELLNGDD